MRVGGLGITNGTQSLSLPTAPGTKIVKVWVENAGTVARFLSPSLALLLCAADPDKVPLHRRDFIFVRSGLGCDGSSGNSGKSVIGFNLGMSRSNCFSGVIRWNLGF